MDKFQKTLLDISKVLSDNFQLGIFRNGQLDVRCSSGKSLLKVDSNSFEFIDEGILKLMADNKSKLTDALLNFDDIAVFCKTVRERSDNIALNHIGFCYQVASKYQEKKRLLEISKNKGFNLYEIYSNDPSLWLFIGSDLVSKDTVIEFLPVERTNDYYADYWLPCVHFAVHTELSAVEIKYITHEIFKGTTRAHPTVIFGNVVYQSRIWLGVVSGINFCFDLFTNELRSLSESRRNLRRII